jgi:hypothetical protein
MVEPPPASLPGAEDVLPPQATAPKKQIQATLSATSMDPSSAPTEASRNNRPGTVEVRGRLWKHHRGGIRTFVADRGGWSAAREGDHRKSSEKASGDLVHDPCATIGARRRGHKDTVTGIAESIVVPLPS